MQKFRMLLGAVGIAGGLAGLGFGSYAIFDAISRLSQIQQVLIALSTSGAGIYAAIVGIKER